MSNLYDDFEKKYADRFFSAGWVEVELKVEAKQPQRSEVFHKDVKTLEAELSAINEQIENISLKQLRLSNLAKMYD